MHGYEQKNFADYIYFSDRKKLLHPQATLKLATSPRFDYYY